jgi:hypothetical protein
VDKFSRRNLSSASTHELIEVVVQDGIEDRDEDDCWNRKHWKHWRDSGLFQEQREGRIKEEWSLLPPWWRRIFLFAGTVDLDQI